MLLAGFSAAHQLLPARPADGVKLRDFVIADAGGPVSDGTRFQLGWNRFTDGTGTATYSKDGEPVWSGAWTDPTGGRASINDLSATALANFPADAAAKWASIVGNSKTRKTVATFQTNVPVTPVGDAEVQVGDYRVSAYNITTGRAFTKEQTQLLLAGMCPDDAALPTDTMKVKVRQAIEVDVYVFKSVTEVEIEGTGAQWRDIFKRFGLAICAALKEILPEKILKELRPHVPCLRNNP